MLGIKVRQVIPAPAVSLEELVPLDHFYRHLEQVLDLTFVAGGCKMAMPPMGGQALIPSSSSSCSW
jgi:hypothetical protein